MLVPSVPPAPGRFSTTMDWPSSAESRSNTSRGTTSVALPAPNGIVALITCDGHSCACAANAKRRPESTQIDRMDLNINTPVSSVLHVAYVARTVPLFIG